MSIETLHYFSGMKMKMKLILKIFNNPKYVITVFAEYCLGVRSSPLLIMSTIKINIETYNSEDQKVFEQVLRSLRVGYLKSGSENIQNCYNFYSKVKARLKASFNLWIF